MCERLDSCSGFCLCAGWYWGAVTAAQAHAALQEACEGAFLVRDSSHPMYMLTLSVRTARGPTSIRIQYSGAQFLLDSSSPARPSLSSFPSVPSLVQHYMGQEKKAEEGKMEVEAPSKPSQQTIQETSVVLKLKRAVYKPTGLPSLQHLTRLVINTHCDCADQLPLPRPLLRFIQDYPFKVWGVGPDLQSRDLGAANSETNNGQSRWPEPDGWRVTVGPRRKNWTQGQTFFTEVICTISGETDVSDVGLSLWRTEGWSVPQRGGGEGEKVSTVLYTHSVVDVEIVCLYFTLLSSRWTFYFLDTDSFERIVLFCHIFSTFYKCSFFSIKTSIFSLTFSTPPVSVSPHRKILSLF